VFLTSCSRLFLIAPVAGVAVSVVNARCDSRGHRSGGGRGGALSGCPTKMNSRSAKKQVGF